jgi:hypothetical protein
MRAHAHALAALPLAAGILSLTGSPELACAGAAASLAVDMDHIPDYMWWRGGWRGVKDFFRAYHLHQVVRMTIPLHSWELAPVWALVLHLLGWPAWGWVLALGWLWHLIWDQLTNPVGCAFYFFTWRARRGFAVRLARPLWGARSKSP